MLICVVSWIIIGESIKTHHKHIFSSTQQLEWYQSSRVINFNSKRFNLGEHTTHYDILKVFISKLKPNTMGVIRKFRCTRS